MSKLDLIELVGMGLTLEGYREQVLDGAPFHFEQEALKFECTGCGACCERPGVIYLTDDEVDGIAEHLGMDHTELRGNLLEMSEEGWMIRVTRRKQCVFYKDKKCIVHEAKPWQCRAYPFWPEIVCEKQDWQRERPNCEGVDHGRAYSAAEVRAILLGQKPTWSQEP